MRVQPDSAEEPEITEGRPSVLSLRLLATSDLHMQLLDYDFLRDRPSENGSLAKLASLIEEARKGVDLCLLFDNGDTLQGTPVADYLAQMPAPTPHPMAEAFNLLGYDAVGLGNHDTDFGLTHLAGILSQYNATVVCGNMMTDALPMVQDRALLTREVTGSTGATETIRIGVVSALPQMTESWNRHHLSGRARISPALQSISTIAESLRQSGADLVVALAHMGIAMDDEGDEPLNLVVDIARLPQIDAVIGGHTHMRFPGVDHKDTPGVDTSRGLISDTPVVQPGHAGSDLGQIDFELERSRTGWRILSTRCALRATLPGTPESPAITRLSAAAHAATRSYLNEEVAEIERPMHSYFALARPCPVSALLAEAKIREIAAAVEDPDLAALPLLAAVSAQSTGGLEGPQNFVSFERGTLRRRDIVSLNPYANQVWAVRTNGARVRDWLERSALIYNTLELSRPGQTLVDPKVPGFRSDTIHGLTYVIDPTQPPAFDTAGRRIPGRAGRIIDLRYAGKPVGPTDEFLVATTDYRVGGGGAHPPFSDEEIVVRGTAPLNDALLHYLAAPDYDAIYTSQPWRFAGGLGLTATLHTSPSALHHMVEIDELSPEVSEMTEDGFLGIRLHL